MTHEQVYRWRWVYVVTLAMVAYLYYAYLIAPQLDRLVGGEVVEVTQYPVQFVSYFWTGDSDRLFLQRKHRGPWHGVELSMPRDQMFIWFAALGPPVLLGVFLFVVFWVARRDSDLPARRQMHWMWLVAFAIAFGTLTLATVETLSGLSRGGVMFHAQRVYLEVTTKKPAVVAWTSGLTDSTSVPYATIAVLGTVCSGVVLACIRRWAVMYWQLERLTLVLVVWSLLIVILSYGAMAARFPRSSQDCWDAISLAGVVLIGAGICRVALLFRMQRFYRAAMANPDLVCFACGYDLRGSIGSTSGPECGAVVVQTDAPPATTP